MQELAKFYGFDLEGAGSNAMTDEQILAMLSLGSAIEDVNPDQVAKAEADAAEKKAAEESATPSASDEHLAFLKVMPKESSSPQNDKEKAADLLHRCCEKLSPPSMEKLSALVKSGVTVRCVDATNDETPLHKLARQTMKGVQPELRQKGELRTKYQELIALIVSRLKEECKEKCKDDVAAAKAVGRDVNSPNKEGKTPLFICAESMNEPMVAALYDPRNLETKEQPDVMVTSKNGWTVMHAIVSNSTNAEDLEFLKYFVSKLSPARLEAIKNSKDAQGRVPLHIASFKAHETVLEYCLKDLKMKDLRDKSGHSSKDLAGKSNRRKSRELIEQFCQDAPK